LAKLVEWLFEKYYSKMYHMILGLVIGSTLAIFFTEIMPGFKAEALAMANMSFGKTLFLSILLFAIGTVLSWLFSKVEDRYDPEKVVVNEDWKEES
jgi:putative membrane protein